MDEQGELGMLGRGLRDAIERSREATPHRTVLFRAPVRFGASTGRTQHSRNGRALAEPRAVTISQLDGDPGFYLSYLDADSMVQTDTYHGSLGSAFDQARFEFSIRRGDWSAVS
jgi:hypothetical protein